MKDARQAKIIEIIAKGGVGTQEQLTKMLRDCRFPVTQATVSRDIHELRLVKTLGGDGVYQYALPEPDGDANGERLRSIFANSVVACDSAQNLVIIKTLPGLASAAAAALDARRDERIAGTIAGDDTVFIAARDNAAAKSYLSEITSHITQSKTER